MKFIFFLFLLSALPSFAQDDFETDSESAYRDLQVPYEFYEKNLLKKIENEKLFDSTNAIQTALGSAKLYKETALPKAISWKDANILQERFVQMRDARFLEWEREPGFLRRETWLFPDDGCYSRASVANSNFFKWFLPVPNKVFAFGHLRVKTSNSPRGVVGWWYHVAPIVEVDKVKYVLDPSIEPARPLPLKEWLGRMGKPEKMKVSICASGTYSPRDNCARESDGLELRARKVQQWFLEKEWSRLETLKRDPKQELGEAPPWL
ncbi:MAG TPA: protein-glutamine glutaminase family protein [Bacteriovoracaceae bacterium]|nr:protein-glutamine glutaminase family protein [Bacteriovoracaceae bacterium]